MAKVFLVSIFLIIIPFILKTNGLTMKMIPIHSPHLQIIPQHFTAPEKHQYFVNISKSRTYNYRRDNSTLTPDSFEAPVYGVVSSYYITTLVIGEGPGAYFAYLILDTGDEQTWVQCEGCNPCFEVKGKSFAYKESPNYARMSTADTLCGTTFTYDGSCKFNAFYSKGQATGFVGRDNFYFKNPKTGNIDVYKGLAFGCALENRGFNFGGNTGPQNAIVGIHGLAPGRRSFLKQLDDQIKGRFSYCIPSWREENPTESTMYFGDDAQISGDDTRQVQVISMYSKFRYHLYLNGISVDGSRLNIDRKIFELDPIKYTTGFIIDSGSPYTTLARTAHDPLRDAIAKYFLEKYGWKPMTPGGDIELCYNIYPHDDLIFPSVILHFARQGQAEEVDMVLNKDNMFQKFQYGQGYFCMMVVPTKDPGPCVFGAFQQANFKYLYDVSNSLFYFVPQRCQENHD